MTLFYCSIKINKTFKMYTLFLIGKLTKMSMANHVQMLFRMIKYHHLLTSNNKKQIMVHSCDVKTKSYWLFLNVLPKFPISTGMRALKVRLWVSKWRCICCTLWIMGVLILWRCIIPLSTETISYDYADLRWNSGNSYEYNMIIFVFVFILAHIPGGACGLVTNGLGNHNC